MSRTIFGDAKKNKFDKVRSDIGITSKTSSTVSPGNNLESR
jgi:hypothetical protein